MLLVAVVFKRWELIMIRSFKLLVDNAALGYVENKFVTLKVNISIAFAVDVMSTKKHQIY